jgi:hypothetical protein
MKPGTAQVARETSAQSTNVQVVDVTVEVPLRKLFG